MIQFAYTAAIVGLVVFIVFELMFILVTYLLGIGTEQP